MGSNEIDRTVIESADGRMYLITLRDDDTLTAAAVTEFDDMDSLSPLRTWNLATLADVAGALSIDVGREMYLDASALANTLQWARV